MEKLDVPQGTLDLMILTILVREPMHGYGISQRLASAQSRSVPGQSGIAVPVAVPSGAGRQAQGGMAGHREQSARQVLPASRPPAVGSSDSIGIAGSVSRSPSRVCWRAHDASAPPCVHPALDAPTEPG